MEEKINFNKNEIYEGIYRKNHKGFGFVKIEDQEEEIYVSKEKSLNALNQDSVVVKIIKQKEKEQKPEGKIIKIKKHEKNMVVGIFQKNKSFGVLGSLCFLCHLRMELFLLLLLFCFYLVLLGLCP